MNNVLLQRDGHSFEEKPTLNTAGYIYVVFVCLYTTILVVGGVYLWLLRHKPEVRMRNIVSTLLAVFSIHVYVAALFIVYPLNRSYKCGTEFWYMSIVFPTGIAMFQASNVRLMGFSKVQSGLVDLRCWGRQRHQGFSLRPVKFKKWYDSITYTRKTYFFIIVGVIVQFAVTFVLFFTSRRFSPSTGIFGHQVDPTECRRGPEWIPSVLWQFTWTWIIGPYILFKTRHIKDTHLWAWQTRLAIIAGLPGTPMWLGFLYSRNDRLADINGWFPPAMWFGPGLITMQVSSIIFPLIDIYRSPQPQRPGSVDSRGSKKTTSSSSTEKSELASSFTALEFQLNHNINPLLQFAATRDFTAENIGFLQDVRDFKKTWKPHATLKYLGSSDVAQQKLRHQMFHAAALIFFEHVCPATSQANINIDARTYSDLESVFKDLTYDPPKYASSNSADAAKDNVIAPWLSPPSSGRPSADADIDPLELPQSVGHRVSGLGSVRSKLGTTAQFYNPYFVPSNFSIDVFKAAEIAIKYLVYTNTWRKYVDAADVESINESITSSDNGPVGYAIYDTELKAQPQITEREFNSELKAQAYITGHEVVITTPNSATDTPASTVVSPAPAVDGQDADAGAPVDARCVACRRRDERREAARARVLSRKTSSSEWDFLN